MVSIKKTELKEILKDALCEAMHNNSTHNNNSSKRPVIDPDKVSLFNDPKVRSGQEWAKLGGNFAVQRNGNVYYVSRSIAVSLYVFCKNIKGEWCILANQRGPNAQSNRGKWNVPAGYLDYNETAQYAAKRECWEETGVNVPISKIQMMGVNSGKLETDDDIEHRTIYPARGKQDVTIRFAAVLNGLTDHYPLSDAHCEPGEVSDIQWIPLSKVLSYDFAYNQGYKILSQAKTSVGDQTNVNDVNAMIYQLKDEIKNNPTAMYLLNNILKILSK